MSIETVEKNGVRYAEIIWANTIVKETTFYSPPQSSFQFGLLAHRAGFHETPHYHRPFKREIQDLQQMFIVQKGLLVVMLYDDAGELFREIELTTGDAIVLIHGTHAIQVKEDVQCISVKQGPFLGTEYDKVPLEIKE